MGIDTEKMIRVYQCEDNTDGILSAIYDAGISGYGHDYIRIEPQVQGEEESLLLFAEYVPVTTDREKAEKVVRSVRTKISMRAYRYMMYAIAAAAPDRGDALYQFLTYGFSLGDRVCDMLQFPPAKRVFELQRAVGNEAHFSLEFLRFQQIQKNPELLYASFEPKNRVLPMVMEHFCDRFPEEYFIIYDRMHREAGFHVPDREEERTSSGDTGGAEIHILTEEEAEVLERFHEKEDEYPDLWKTFFHSIAIKERENEALQKSLMPLHYRKYVTEFLD